MSTRAAVILEREDGTYRAIYVHHDGYPQGLGKTLQNHYNTVADIESLLALGDASGVEATVDESVFYHRDRGEKQGETSAMDFKTLAECCDFYEGNWCEYFYLFSENWSVAGITHKFRKL